MASPPTSLKHYDLFSAISCPLCSHLIGAEGIGHQTDDRIFHLFHQACITPWLTDHHTCPTCLTQITGVQPIPPEEVAILPPLYLAQGEEFARAAAVGDLNDMDRLLAQSSPLSRGTALYISIKRGHVNFALRILEDPSELLEQSRNVALIAASKAGYHPIVQTLLDNRGPISIATRGLALCGATEHDQQAVVQTLLTGNEIELKPLHFLGCVYTAIERSHLPILQMLLANGREPPKNTATPFAGPL